MMKTQYLLINLSNNQIVRYRTEESVAIFLLGRRIDNFIIVKNDAVGARVAAVTRADYNAIKRDLLAA